MKEYNYEHQHTKGKLHAIERINLLVDYCSFHEIGGAVTEYASAYDKSYMAYDGVITGYAEIDKKPVYIYAQDFSISGGTVGLKHGEKISRIIQMAIRSKCPVIGISDSGGARIQEGVNSLAGYGRIFYYNTLASGYIPQISIIAGPCAGGAVYSPGITDFVFMVRIYQACM
jgi:acetyl-CoA carboxylase carboxyltransferase component